jgi:cytochrome c oxidase subunit 2
LCNKICGSAHYNMQMNVIVETQEEYDAWVKEQKTISETL